MPLFVKAPGQRRGRTSAAYARTIDLVPTIADVLNIRMPYRADGRSAFSRAVRSGAGVVRMIKRDFSGIDHCLRPAMERRRRALVARRNSAVRLRRHPHPVHRASARTGSCSGRPAAQLRPRAQGKIRAAIADANDIRAVKPTLADPARPDRRSGARRPARCAARRGGGRERPDRGGGPHLLPARQPAGELRGERARGVAAPRTQHRRGVPGHRRRPHAAAHRGPA